MSFLEIISRQNDKINFEETFIIAIVFQNNHHSYPVFFDRNMPLFYNYEKLQQNLSITTLVKGGPGGKPRSTSFATSVSSNTRVTCSFPEMFLITFFP